MAYVLTNGCLYVTYNDFGEIKKTHDIERAIIYERISSAVDDIKRAPRKTKGFYVYDTVTENICYERLSPEEMKEIGKKQNLRAKRRNFSNAVRKRVYEKADGYCQLCGRKILYEEMTLDHIVPLAMCGDDVESNLQCTCRSCNELKRNIMPEEFTAKVRDIFTYQMTKKFGDSIKWKITNRLIQSLLGKI